MVEVKLTNSEEAVLMLASECPENGKGMTPQQIANHILLRLATPGVKRFSLPKFSTIDKKIEVVDSEDEVKLTIDYDDVNHPVVKKLVGKIVRILNKLEHRKLVSIQF